MCDGVLGCFPLYFISFSMVLAPVLMLIFVISGAMWVRQTKKGAEPPGRLLRRACTTTGTLLVVMALIYCFIAVFVFY